MHIQLHIVSKLLLFVNFRGVQFRGRGYILYQLADMYRKGPNPLADMDRGVHIRGESKSAVTTALLNPPAIQKQHWYSREAQIEPPLIECEWAFRIQALKYQSVTDIVVVPPIDEIVRRGEETTGRIVLSETEVYCLSDPSELVSGDQTVTLSKYVIQD
jgi:hypothetical protein